MGDWTGPTISYKYSDNEEPLLIPIVPKWVDPHEDSVVASSRTFLLALNFCEKIPFEDLPKYIHHVDETIKFIVIHKLRGIDFPSSDEIRLGNWYVK